jgi:hypothetical protein
MVRIEMRRTFLFPSLTSHPKIQTVKSQTMKKLIYHLIRLAAMEISLLTRRMKLTRFGNDQSKFLEFKSRKMSGVTSFDITES